MAKISIKAGTTSKLLDLFIQDSSSTTGAGLTGLVFNSAGLTAYYYREGAASATAITLATMTLGTWGSGGFIVIDGTNMPGCYQIGIPDAAIASGAKTCLVMLKGATNMAPLVLEIELTAVDNQSATAFITGVNSLAPPTNWNLMSIDGSGRLDVIKIAGTTQTARDIGASVLLSSGTGTGQLDFTSGVVKSNTVQWNGSAVATPAVSGVPIVDAKYILGTAVTEGGAGRLAGAFTKQYDIVTPVFTAASVNQTGDNYARLGAPAGASVSADIAAVKSDAAAILLQTGTNGVVVASGSKTGYALTAAYDPAKTAAQAGDAMALTSGERTTLAGVVHTTAMTEAYAADGAAFTLAQGMYMIWSLAAEKNVSGTTLTAKKLNGSTASMTFTLNDATSPTSITRST